MNLSDIPNPHDWCGNPWTYEQWENKYGNSYHYLTTIKGFEEVLKLYSDGAQSSDFHIRRESRTVVFDSYFKLQELERWCKEERNLSFDPKPKCDDLTKKFKEALH